MTNTATQTTTVTPIQATLKEPVKPLTLTQRIDADEGLKAKRKLLSVVSLILLAIVFSGAKVVEANTFIMKISFTNQNGITHLLLLSIVFLMIRYYNYAQPYHKALYKSWTERMLRDRYFYQYCEHSDDASGLTINFKPNDLKTDQYQHECGPWRTEYRCSWLLFRNIDYFWSDSHGYESYSTINLFKVTGVQRYLRVLIYELKYQTISFLTHRENLDILAPYLLGMVSIISFVFNEEVIAILKGFTS